MPRIFALIPAAGHSRRMGQPKLLLPLGDQTVIARVLAALDHPAITARLVVVRPEDTPLAEEATRHGARVIVPAHPPAEMRESVALALDAVRREFDPQPEDAWMLIPADHPVLDPAVVEDLITAWTGSPTPILVPTHNGRRGHPTLFTWPLANEVDTIPPGHGLNWLVKQHAAALREHPVSSPNILTDLDTPEDYERLKRLPQSGRCSPQER